MFTKIIHQYSRYVNQTLDWLPLDDRIRYKYNLENNYDLLNENNWVDKEFTYKFNSHGFRCEEFTTDPNVIFLGCSHTFGIGLPLENTWAYLVSQQLNLKMVNLAIGGTGPDTAFRLFHHYVEQFKPKVVIYYPPSNARFSVIHSGHIIYNFNPLSHIPKKFENFYLTWASNEENLILNEEKHKLAIESLCSKNSTKLVIPPVNSFIKIDHARDLGHNGIESNLIFSNKILKCFN